MDAPPAECPLTDRQLEVIAAAADGLNRAEIGQRLYMAETTVKTHLHAAAVRLGARSTTHAVAIALRAGWVE